MKLYFDPGHYHKENRAYLAEILRPIINNRSLEENVNIYGEQITQYESVHDPKDADLHVLTMTWGYYFETKQLTRAQAFIEQAHSVGKPLAVWHNGDFSLRCPPEGAWLFQCGGHRSTRRLRQFAQPVFIGDPLKELNQPTIALRPKVAQPVVGFCGQAEFTAIHALSTWLRYGQHNLRILLHRSPYEPLPLHPLPTLLRGQALHYLEQVPGIRSNFIKRKQYGAGAHNHDTQTDSRRDYWQNMLASDYIVCLRGTGNFSARLYETLAMGRIPIFIDTDCTLPYEDSINWKEYCVWVDVSELNLLPQKLLDFHASLDADAFQLLQQRCRELWEERLSFSGFFSHFAGHFPEFETELSAYERVLVTQF